MQLSVKQKLLVIIVPILMALIYFAGVQILQARESESVAKTVAGFVELSAYNSRLTHELQKERGMSAGFLGSGGKKFSQQLSAQRKQTDKRLQELQSYLMQHDKTLREYPELWQVVEKVNTMSSRISSIRSGVTALTLPLSEALNYYTTMNRYLLSVPGMAVKVSGVAEISQFLVAYYEFLQGKERAGIERAVLSNTFGQKVFAPGIQRKFITLVSEQNSYFSTFLIYASHKHVQNYNKIQSGPEGQLVNQYRELAFSGELDQNPEAWFAASTKRIELLKQEEDQLTEHILSLTDKIVASKTQIFWFYLVLSVALIILALFISYVLLSGIQRQVFYLNRTMGQAANKDLSTRCEEIGRDELGQIATNLNAMLNELTEAVNIISDSSEQLAAAAEESTFSVQQNADNLQKQQADVVQVVTAIEEMSVSVKEVAQNIQNTSDEADTANSQIISCNALVGESTRSIQEVCNRIESVSVAVHSLHQSSSNISGVVDVIQGIAEQTNLLALNAAIEAARAGDQGRGFAVVADEVRSLAQRTQDSTQEIEAMVAKLQQDSNSTFDQINDASEYVNISVQKADEVTTALEFVVASINTIRDMATQIASAAEEQVLVSGDIAARAQSIGDSVQHTTESGQQIAIAAEEQARLSDKLQHLVGEFKVG